MKYIYDILLNFNEKLYEFYEWDDCDNFDYVKKIAIIKVNKDTLNDIRNNKIMLDDEFVKEIHNTCEVYTSKSIKSIEYACLFTSNSSIIACLFNYKGISIMKSDLLLDEGLDIIEICKKLNLHDKIISLKDGYETKISSDTDIFSEGEKQLLNFTRVMVENPEIIILDEATASLSYKSEMLVRKAIEEITKGKISFIIAHRLSTIKNCNKILLMKDGKIIEEGTHNELMNRQGEYYELVNS